MSKNFYVYYSYEEFGRGYIGSRGCKCLPKDDVKYFGSFKDKTFKPTQKIILGVYESREDAYEAEILLHEFYDIARNPHFANRSKQTSKKFTTSGVRFPDEVYKKTAEKNKGRIVTEEQRLKISIANKGKKRSKEFCEHMRRVNLGRKKTPQEIEKHRKNMMGNQHAKGNKLTDKHKNRLMEFHSTKLYSIINPQGEEIIFNNLRKFSRETNLNRTYLLKFLSSGQWKQYNGWTNFKVLK
jgi:hypothetical protein